LLPNAEAASNSLLYLSTTEAMHRICDKSKSSRTKVSCTHSVKDEEIHCGLSHRIVGEDSESHTEHGQRPSVADIGRRRIGDEALDNHSGVYATANAGQAKEEVEKCDSTARPFVAGHHILHRE